MQDGKDLHRFSGSHGTALPHVSIDEALSNNWLDIWYQPKIDLRRKCFAGAEALVRMNHPQAGLLWPADYLCALDDHGLLKLSEYAVLTSMHHWEIFAEAGFGLRLSINVPAKLLPKSSLGELVAAHRPRAEK